MDKVQNPSNSECYTPSSELLESSYHYTNIAIMIVSVYTVKQM
jgi:hypothetical protein